MPEFPGAANISVTCGERASRHARACSLPPEPTMRIRTSVYSHSMVPGGLLVMS